VRNISITFYKVDKITLSYFIKMYNFNKTLYGTVIAFYHICNKKDGYF